MNVLVKDWMKQKKQKGLKPRKYIYIYVYIYVYIFNTNIGQQVNIKSIL